MCNAALAARHTLPLLHRNLRALPLGGARHHFLARPSARIRHTGSSFSRERDILRSIGPSRITRSQFILLISQHSVLLVLISWVIRYVKGLLKDGNQGVLHWNYLFFSFLKQIPVYVLSTNHTSNKYSSDTGNSFRGLRVSDIKHHVFVIVITEFDISSEMV